MKTKKQLRLTVRKILKEDGDAFQRGLSYIKNTDGLKKDALSFAKEKGDEEEAKEWFNDGVGEWIRELGDTAEAIDDLGEEMLSNYTDSDEEMIDDDDIEYDLDSDQQAIIDNLEKQKDLQGFLSLYKKAAQAFYQYDIPTMKPSAFARQLKEDGIEKTIEYVKETWSQAYPKLGEMFEKLITADNFEPEVWGLESDKKAEQANDDKANDGEATIEDTEDDLSDMEDQLDALEDSLGDFIEQAYKAKETEEYKSLVKTYELLQKYADFTGKLFHKIIDFAEKKERQDVVDLTQNNISAVNAWCDLRNNQMNDLADQLAADDDGYDPDSEEGGNPSEKTMKALAKHYKEMTDHFKVIVAGIKKNPLKKIDTDNILKEARRHGNRALTEIRLRQYSRKRMQRMMRG